MKHLLLVLSALCLANAARAESFTFSAASAGSSASEASSTSLHASSNSSNRATARAELEGDYRIVAITEVAGRPDHARITLQGKNDASREFALDVPVAVRDEAKLTAQDLVRVVQRPYGWRFARAEAAQPFFLVIDDAWTKDMQIQAVNM